MNKYKEEGTQLAKIRNWCSREDSPATPEEFALAKSHVATLLALIDGILLRTDCMEFLAGIITGFTGGHGLLEELHAESMNMRMRNSREAIMRAMRETDPAAPATARAPDRRQ